MGTTSRSLAAGLLGPLALLALLAAGDPARAEAAPEPASHEPSTGSAPGLEDFMRGMASTSGVIARFREVKQLALLSEPLEVRGTLYFVPPDRLARVTVEPAASRLVIDGQRFVFRDAAGGEEVDLSQNPVAREFVANFIVLFNGDVDALRERYEPTFSLEGDAWSLALRPRRRPLSDVVARVELHGEGRRLTRIEMLETDGDSTTTWFDAVEVDHRFSAAELARIFAGPDAPAPAPPVPPTSPESPKPLKPGRP